MATKAFSAAHEVTHRMSFRGLQRHVYTGANLRGRGPRALKCGVQPR